MGSKLALRPRPAGIRLKKRATRLFRRVFSRHRPAATGRIFTGWRTKLRNLLRFGNSGYGRLDRVREDSEPDVPKGHLAVYVGEKEAGGSQRVVMPVIYINHPLFGRLLKEAEEKTGFNHPGGINIPCPVSEFESVTTRIDSGWNRKHGLLTWY